MKKFYKKLHSKAGETLVETVAAILVFTFSSIILLSMIAAATKLNTAAKQHDASISTELNIAEAQDENYSGTSTDKTAVIKIYAPGSDTPQTVGVTKFSSGSGTLYSYSYRAG